MTNKYDNNDPDDPEESIFAKAMEDVRPLNQPNKVQHTSKPPKISFDRENEDTGPVFVDPSEDQQVGTEDSLYYCAGGLQQSQAKKLKRGQFTIEARLDLHGMTKDQANIALGIFIEESQHRGLRCVNVVHGKGYRSSDSVGVLKSAVNHWLRQHSEVVAFASSPPKDGGTGAVNILLRREQQ